MKFLSKADAPVENNRVFLGERVKIYCNTLRQLSYRHRVLLTDVRIADGNYCTLEEAEQAGAQFRPYQNGDLFGKADSHAFFDITMTVPAGWEAGCAGLLATGGSSTLFSGPQMNEGRILYTEGQTVGSNVPPHLLLSVNGRIVQGMDVNHQEVRLHELAPGETARIGINAYIPREGCASYLKFEAIEVDDPCLQLFYDLYTPIEAVDAMGDTTETAQAILRELDKSVSCIDLREPYSPGFYEGIAAARENMRRFYSERCSVGEKVVSAIGHTHIDVAWKWDLSQTREKVVRSLSTVLRLMEEYPEYQFMLSQPQLYEFMKEEAPELYEKIRERVKEGRWEVEGAMWLEPDTNLPSGESLVRQILFGKRFFREEFGQESEVLWLPDVFGYSAALPQILSKSGIRYFATAKLGWNQYNVFPYTTFRWKGLDGSSVLVQLITTQEDGNRTARTTYNGMLGAPHVMGNYRRHTQSDVTQNTLMPFGYGDGGGGPTPQMLEKNRRLSKGIPGVPAVRTEHVKDYFHRLEKTAGQSDNLPCWKGELYFECHRGTYTSVAEIKENNRHGEILLKQLEQLAARAYLKTGKYPEQELQALWKVLLLNQFHDILPGSSIRAVYEDSAAQFADLFRRGGRLMEQLRAELAQPAGEYVTVCNTTGFARGGLAVLEGEEGLLSGGAPLECQRTQLAGRPQTLVALPQLPANSLTSFAKAPAQQGAGNLTAQPDLLENGFFRIQLNQFGEFVSLWDKQEERELLEGNGNVITAFQDLPSRHDNWNIDVFYRKKAFPIRENASVTVAETGPLRATLRVEKTFSHSRLRQDISIYRDSRRIDFDTVIFWEDDHFMVKAGFPTAIHSDDLVCDIQFGNIRRSTLKNTSWDLARFEVPAHKWVDLSERDYGISLLSADRYGFTLEGSLLELTLLRSGTFPHESAGRGEHHIRYALYPHAGDFASGGTDREAVFFQEPLLFWDGKADEAPLAETEEDGIVLETIKKCEEGEGLILRLYENHNRRARAKLRFHRPYRKISVCNLMEEPTALLAENQSQAELVVNPYEIVTLKLEL